jgi:catechol 2,3-dioxygenase-like lactoylglutathione lyase family enzyme
MTAFYTEILGLRPGARPPFRFPGAWLYCGERAAVHLVEVAKTPDAGEPRIEHFAMRAVDLSEFLTHLRERDVAYRISIVPGLELRQVNIHDPDGNHIEIAFGAEEEADLTDYPAMSD